MFNNNKHFKYIALFAMACGIVSPAVVPSVSAQNRSSGDSRAALASSEGSEEEYPIGTAGSRGPASVSYWTPSGWSSKLLEEVLEGVEWPADWDGRVPTRPNNG